jgi:hypothetical protein
VRKAGQSSKRRRLARQLRLFPRQFWLLVGGTFFYLLVIGLAFPYTAILIKERLGVSMAVVGAIMGGTALAGLPPERPFRAACRDDRLLLLFRGHVRQPRVRARVLADLSGGVL